MKRKEKNFKGSWRVKKGWLNISFYIASFNTLIGKKKKQRIIYCSHGHNNFYIHSTRQLYFITLAWAPILSKVPEIYSLVIIEIPQWCAIYSVSLAMTYFLKT